jgi:hypothetical protein
MSAQAYDEFCVLDTALRDCPLSGDKDVWFYEWGENIAQISSINTSMLIYLPLQFTLGSGSRLVL